MGTSGVYVGVLVGVYIKDITVMCATSLNVRYAQKRNTVAHELNCILFGRR